MAAVAGNSAGGFGMATMVLGIRPLASVMPVSDPDTASTRLDWKAAIISLMFGNWVSSAAGARRVISLSIVVPTGTPILSFLSLIACQVAMSAPVWAMMAVPYMNSGCGTKSTATARFTVPSSAKIRSNLSDCRPMTALP